MCYHDYHNDDDDDEMDDIDDDEQNPVNFSLFHYSIAAKLTDD